MEKSNWFDFSLSLFVVVWYTGFDKDIIWIFLKISHAGKYLIIQKSNVFRFLHQNTFVKSTTSIPVYLIIINQLYVGRTEILTRLFVL